MHTYMDNVTSCTRLVVEFMHKYVLVFFCRDIVKLTAQFVARNGAQFLDKLMVREQVGKLTVGKQVAINFTFLCVLCSEITNLTSYASNIHCFPTSRSWWSSTARS